jgi:hypothetical protein
MCLDKSYRGPLHMLIDGQVVVDTLTGINSAYAHRWSGSCGHSDRHQQCTGKVPFCCQQEQHTQGFLDVLTGKIPKDSNLVSIEAMPFLVLYLSINDRRCHFRPSHGIMFWSTIMYAPHSCCDC